MWLPKNHGVADESCERTEAGLELSSARRGPPEFGPTKAFAAWSKGLDRRPELRTPRRDAVQGSLQHSPADDGHGLLIEINKKKFQGGKIQLARKDQKKQKTL